MSADEFLEPTAGPEIDSPGDRLLAERVGWLEMESADLRLELEELRRRIDELDPIA